MSEDLQNQTEQSFEDVLSKLEDITSSINDENISLQDSLELCKQGQQLAEVAREILDKVELDMQTLIQSSENE